MHSKRSLLFENDVAWVKKGDSGEFDVTMGSFDGGETCESVGLYIFDIWGNKFGKEIFGLYRDDGLACLKNLNGHQSDKLRKDITKVFKEMGLALTIQSNLTMVNFLDVTFNLKDGTYKPYKKPNDIPTYININSNHPANIIKQISTIISKRMSQISSNEEMFKNVAPYYENALKASGYQQKLSYQSETLNEGSRRNRSRKIIWLTHHLVNVKSNIAREFLYLITKHVKVSHSCMPSVESYIKSHNVKILSNKKASDAKSCNCRDKATCPLHGNCLIDSIIYRGNVTTSNKEDENNYIGLTENQFKGRERYHHHTFQNEEKKSSTQLSNYMWYLKKEKNNVANITYSVIEKTSLYKNGNKRCPLCLAEKYHVIFQPFKRLNKRGRSKTRKAREARNAESSFSAF